MFCDQPDRNALIKQQHVKQCGRKGNRGRKGTLNYERDCEIVCPRPSFLSRVVEKRKERVKSSEMVMSGCSGEVREFETSRNAERACDMDVIQCGLSECHAAGARLNLPADVLLHIAHKKYIDSDSGL